MVSEDRLRTLLRVAESAHAAYEQELGQRDDDWPTWYARFIVERLREDPEGVTHQLFLDDAEHRLLVAASTRTKTPGLSRTSSPPTRITPEPPTSR